MQNTSPRQRSQGEAKRQRMFCCKRKYYAGMAELADVQDLGSCASRRAGSTPVTRTRQKNPNFTFTKVGFGFLLLYLSAWM
jgi:hypothetical protein